MRPVLVLRALIVGFAALAAGWHLHVTLPRLGHTTFDDAYIFIRYARHWLSGSGFCWNQADGPAYGVTSVLHLLIVTALRGMTQLADGAILTSISFGAGLLSCVLLAVLGFLSVRNRDFRDRWIPILVVPCILLGNLFVNHSVSGMETTLALLCNSILACCVVLYVQRGTILFLAFTVTGAYASYLARPDNGLTAWFFPPLFMVASNHRLRRPALFYALAFGILLVADAAIKNALLGGPVPLPFYAKARGFYSGYLGAFKWNAVDYMLEFSRAALPFLLVTVCLCSKESVPRLAAAVLPVGATFGYYLAVTQIMGWNARYYYPFLPFAALGAFVAIDSWTETQAADGRRPPVSWSLVGYRAVAGLVLLLLTSSSYIQTRLSHLWEARVVGTPVRFEAKTRYEPGHGRALAELGWWNAIQQVAGLMEQLPPHTVLAASEYGYVGSRFPETTILDLLGLQDRRLAQSGFSSEELFERKPDIIWFPHPDYSRIVQQILDNKAFRTGYDYYPGVYDLGIAIRRDSPRFAQIQSALAQAFVQVYPGRDLSEYRATPIDYKRDRHR